MIENVVAAHTQLQPGTQAVTGLDVRRDATYCPPAISFGVYGMGLKSVTIMALAVVASACNAQSSPRAFTPVEGDAFIGKADSSVVLVEYGAPTCPACKYWHDQFWGDLKATYIDTNKIKFVFRPLPSHNPPVDAAIASLARCAGKDQYFAVLDEGFARHQQIEEASASGRSREALVSLAAKFKMSEDQARACIEDPKNVQRILDVQAQAETDGVTGTPTFLLNGRPLQDPRFSAMSRAIEGALSNATAGASQ